MKQESYLLSDFFFIRVLQKKKTFFKSYAVMGEKSSQNTKGFACKTHVLATGS